MRVIANEFCALGEPIPEHKLVRQILRSLPKRFHTKVTAIEEARDLETMTVNDLIGSLLTYEVSIRGHQSENKKSMTFKVNTENLDSDTTRDECQELIDSFALMARKKFRTRPRKGNFRRSTRGEGSASTEIGDKSGK